MNPVDHPEIFETLTLAGITWSGTVEIAGLTYETDWDVQEASGTSGATATRKGKKLAQFSVKFDIIYDPSLRIDQFAEWYETWVPLLRSCTAGEAPVGLMLTHPDAQALDVSSVLVGSIGQVERDPSDYGHGSATVTFLQYAPPKPKPSKPAGGSKGKTKDLKDPGPDPNDPITKRTNELAELLDGP